MAIDYERADDPKWATGQNVSFMDRPSLNIAEYSVRGGSRVEITPRRGQRKIVLKVSGDTVTVRGTNGLPRGTRIVLVFDTDGHSVAVHAAGPFSKFEIATANQVRLSTIRVTHDNSMMLKVATPVDRVLVNEEGMGGPPLHLHCAGDGKVEIRGRRGSLGNLETPKAKHVVIGRIELASGIEVTIAGDLEIEASLPENAKILANSVKVTGQIAGPCRIEAHDSIEITRPVSGSGSARAVLRADVIELNQEASLLDIECGALLSKSSVTESTIVAGRAARVEKSLASTDIRVTGMDSENVSLIVGTFDGFYDGTPASASDGGFGRHERRFRSGADVTDCTLVVESTGLLVVGAVARSNIRAGGDAFARTITGDESTDISVDGRLTVFAALACPGSTLNFGSLAIEGDAEVGSNIAVRERLYVGGSIKGSAEGSFIDTISAEIGGTREAIKLAVTGTLVVKGDDTGLSLSSEGPLELSSDNEITAIGDLQIDATGELRALTVPVRTTVQLRTGSTDTTVHGTVLGTLVAELPGIPNLQIKVDDAAARLKANGSGPALILTIMSGGHLELRCAPASHKFRFTYQDAALANRGGTPAGSLNGLDLGAAGSLLELALVGEHEVAATVEARTELPAPSGAHLCVMGLMAVSLQGQYATLEASTDRPLECPTISLPGADTRVTQASGDVRLHSPIEGRLNGIPGRANTKALRLFSIRADDTDSLTGSLIDIDPTNLP